MKSKRLVIVGTMAIDAIETPFGKKEQVFGGSASYAAYAASFFYKSSIVSIVGEDFPEEYKNLLSARGIDLSHVDVQEGRTFRWKGRYGTDLNAAETLETQINVLSALKPKWDKGQTPDYVFLANVDPKVQLEMLTQMERPRIKLVAADTMNYWIQGSRKDLDKVLAKIDLLVINDGEARLMTGEANLLRAAQKIHNCGPGIVVIKKGEHGVLLHFEGKVFILPAFPLEEVFDPTGAGDTFGGALIGYLASQDTVDFNTLRRGVAYGSVVASFTVERFGLDRLKNLSLGEIDERLSEFRNICTLL